MVKRERPIRAESRKIEKVAMNIVEKLINEVNWASFPASEDDLGIDLFVTVCESQEPRTTTPVDFAAQVKGTSKLVKKGTHVSFAVDIFHVSYWLERPLPVLFLLVDVLNEHIYWLWVKEYLNDELRRIGPKWTNRQTIILRIPNSNRLTVKSLEAIRRQAGRMVWPVVHKNLRPPTLLQSDERDRVFPFKLEKLPYPYIDKNSKELNVLFVSGPTRYELENLEQRFEKKGRGFLDIILQNEIILGDSSFNFSLGAEILAALSYKAGREGVAFNPQRRLLLPYTAVNDDLLEQCNLILIPCGDVNPLLTFALKDFEMLYMTRCPVHHEPYESSEKICYEVTGDHYEKERQDRWAGYILLIPNPWNPQKACLICGGNKGVGTQAALLRLLAAIRGDEPLIGRDGFPCEIVTAKFDDATLFVTGFRKLD